MAKDKQYMMPSIPKIVDNRICSAIVQLTTPEGRPLKRLNACITRTPARYAGDIVSRPRRSSVTDTLTLRVSARAQMWIID